MIKRSLLEPLKAHLNQKEITLIIGPRQSGKTTLMLLLKEYLTEKGENTLFLNLDIESDKKYFVTQTALIDKIKLELGEGNGFIFIDEIQRKENAGIFLKGIYDMNLPYKFIVSGSGSVELKEKVHESLAGRKLTFELDTLSFDEFVNYKTDGRYEGRLKDFFAVDSEKTRGYLNEYLSFGGYPRVVTAVSLEEKRAVISEIYHSYVEKDIFYLLKVEKEEAFSNLIKIIASQSGNLVNYSELSSTLGISQKTVKNYLWYLEKTFILEKSTPFFKNIRKEITKSPIYYFTDLGLRNYVLGIFGNELVVKEGFLFQNFIFRQIEQSVRSTNASINYWRTKDGAEVDFVVEVDGKIIGIETKNKEMKEKEIQRSLRSFINKYQPEKVFLVNLSLNDKTEISKTKVFFVPYCFRGYFD